MPTAIKSLNKTASNIRELTMQTTSVFEANLAAWHGGKRRAFNEGGTSSSKTFSLLQLLILIAQNAKRPFLISVVSESLPHLKRGCVRDFMAIMGDAFDGTRFNKTEHIYKFGLGTIEFFPADEPSKMRGGRRDILFLNEANNVSYDAFRELDVRTRLFTFADWNPVSEFWAHSEGWLTRPDSAFIHSTYMDARSVVPPEIVKAIESNKDTDPNWWNVYGLGRLGKVTGLVYPTFEQVDAMPTGGQEFYGLDFGYSSDPTALVRCIIIGDQLYSEELIYEAGLTNDAIAHRMDEAGVKRNHAEIFADSAEPKSIDEIHKFGFNIKPCPKGADSVEFGHQKVRQYKQYWTKASLNAIKEQRNFRYIADKDGKFTEKTTHMFSHGQDARRYAVVGGLGRARYGFSFGEDV